MTYIYDVLLNFCDDDNRLEFFEWKEEDSLEHIKKIPLFKISPMQMKELCDNKIKVSRAFLDLIKGQTISYKNKKDIKYGSLFTDQNKVISLEFDNKGIVISRSFLLLDEEEDIIDESFDTEEITLSYNIIKQYDIDPFLTREESFKKKFLLKELTNLYNENNLDKFNYLYEERFKKDKLTFDERFKKITTDLKENYNSKYNEIYDIVCLTYNKK